MPLGEPPHYTDPQNQLKEGRLPRREDLDAVAPENPVYIRGIWGYWGDLPITSVANSLALAMASIDAETDAPHGNIEIEKDSQTGEPTGIFREHSFIPTLEFTLFKVVPRFTAAERLKSLRHSMKIYNQYGYTSIYEGHGVAPEVISAYRELWSRGELTVRTYLPLSPTWQSRADAERVLLAWSTFAGRGFGDEWLKFGGVFLECGGDPCAAEFVGREFPYTGWGGFFPKANTLEEYAMLAELAVRHRLRFSTYVGHDLEGPLRILEDLAEQYTVTDLRIVFFHLKFASDDQIQRMRRLNIHSTCTPYANLYKGGGQLLEDPKGAVNAIPLRSLLQSGCPCTLTTDNIPVNPMASLWAAEARQALSNGQVLGTQERLPREELLRCFTSYAANLTFEENQKGTLEVGKLADLVVLSENPMNVSTDGLRGLEVLLTMVGGKVVYQKNKEFTQEV